MALQIDLSNAFSEGRSEIVEKIYGACHNRGFFRITNHGIPLWLVEETISAVQLFHEQPMEEKSEDRRRHYRSAETQEHAHGNFSPTDRRDMAFVPLGPELRKTHWIPDNCVREVFAWDVHTRRLGKVLLELMSEGLGLEKGKLEEMGCLEEREMLTHYYPYGGDIENYLGEGMLLAAGPNGYGCAKVDSGEQGRVFGV